MAVSGDDRVKDGGSGNAVVVTSSGDLCLKSGTLVDLSQQLTGEAFDADDVVKLKLDDLSGVGFFCAGPENQTAVNLSFDPQIARMIENQMTWEQVTFDEPDFSRSELKA